MDEQGVQLKLLTEQAARIDAVSRMQKETEENVIAVRTDLGSVKKAVDGRLSTVEGSLSEMESRWKTELEVREERLKQEWHDELRREMASATTSRHWFEGETRTRVGPSGATSHGDRRPAPFEGKMPWEAYQAQFELVYSS